MMACTVNRRLVVPRPGRSIPIPIAIAIPTTIPKAIPKKSLRLSDSTVLALNNPH